MTMGRKGRSNHPRSGDLFEPEYDEPELELQNRKTVVEKVEEEKGLWRAMKSQVKDCTRKKVENDTKWTEIDNNRVPKENDVEVCAHEVEVVGSESERGRRWIDPRLRWNGDTQGPTKKTAVPLLDGLEVEVRLPPLSPSPSLPLPPNPLEAVNIWRQGVVECLCPLPVTVLTSSSTTGRGIMNRPDLDISVLPDLNFLPDLNPLPDTISTNTNPSTSTSVPNPRCDNPNTDDTPDPHRHATLPLPLGVPPEIPPQIPPAPANPLATLPLEISNGGYTQATQLEPKGDLRLAHFFTQGWLARLRSAQSFIDRARMEREFDDH